MIFGGCCRRSNRSRDAISINPVSVTIWFDSSISSGIRLASKRAAETVFTFLAIETSSPYVDNRSNAAAGPETRQFRAQFLTGDDTIANFSDVLTVAVLGYPRGHTGPSPFFIQV